MYRILRKIKLNDIVTKMVIEAPMVAKKALAGQFIILRVNEDSERIPLTIADYNRELGEVSIIFQIVGASTMLLDNKNEGEYVADFVGPLGNPTKIDNLKKVCVIAGGVGSAIAFPVAKALFEQGSYVTTICGFRNKDLVILEDEFKEVSNDFIMVTDDGSYGIKGNVTNPLKELLEKNESFDEVITIGPLIMMKFVTLTCKEFNVPVTCSMNPIMIDGTGMCGCCRLTLIKNGKKEIRFACVDGPDFNGYEIDFDEAMIRNSMYKEEEKHTREKTCNLLRGAK